MFCYSLLFISISISTTLVINNLERDRRWNDEAYGVADGKFWEGLELLSRKPGIDFEMLSQHVSALTIEITGEERREADGLLDQNRLLSSWAWKGLKGLRGTTLIVFSQNTS